ncbi:hypothetical protein [Streptomyces sp. NPDC058268]|jgi:hypothetical protein|uniref:CIS tube protein n=1 Tax=Streptomyces sp. NPDC058268 TaxID=3346413 RepID=UPI0036F03D9A
MVSLSNPQFDSRMRAFPRLGLTGASKDTPFWRGAIIRDDKSVKAGLLSVNFLFNPGTITVTHQQGYTLTADQQSVDGNKIGAGGIGTLQFELLFDRTYEMYSGGAKTLDDPAIKGVLADVEAVYNITGAYDITAKGAKAKVLQAMQPNPCTFYFGGTATGFLGNNNLSYYGVVSGLTVTYTHFTRDMVPQRCAMSITVDLQTKDSLL